MSALSMPLLFSVKWLWKYITCVRRGFALIPRVDMFAARHIKTLANKLLCAKLTLQVVRVSTSSANSSRHFSTTAIVNCKKIHSHFSYWNFIRSPLCQLLLLQLCRDSIKHLKNEIPFLHKSIHEEIEFKFCLSHRINDDHVWYIE